MRKFQRLTTSFLVTIGLVGWQTLIAPKIEVLANPVNVSEVSIATYQNNIQQKAEAFVDALSEKQFDKATKDLNRDMKQEWSSINAQQYWQDLQKSTGKFEKRVKSTVDDNLVLVTIQFDKVTEDLFVIFDLQGNIVGVDFPAI
ncbi:MAG: DUF3887 domain-containing protein [Hydrococcus sp. Prado102]|jgi:hypothetical protein|nr:DUF3887 domain-containing protein [Hydrococcus sp. Prado102]